MTGVLTCALRSRLTLEGRLRTTDPAQAAEQFIALLTGPVEARSRFGTEQLPEEDLRELAESAVRTFLLAFGSEPAKAVATH